MSTKTPEPLQIYLVERPDRGKYDQYTRFVVVAASEAAARETHPQG